VPTLFRDSFSQGGLAKKGKFSGPTRRRSRKRKNVPAICSREEELRIRLFEIGKRIFRKGRKEKQKRERALDGLEYVYSRKGARGWTLFSQERKTGKKRRGSPKKIGQKASRGGCNP